MSLEELQEPLKVPLEVLQAVLVDKEQCMPVERVTEYVTTKQDQRQKSVMSVFWLSCQQPFPRETMRLVS